MRILTDVDDTLLDFMGSFAPWMAAQGFRKRQHTQDQYGLGPAYGLTEKAIGALLAQFFDEAPSGTMQAMPDALAVVPKLYAAGFEFVAISASPAVSSVIEKRWQNVESVLGIKLKDFIATGLGQNNKRDHLAKFARSVWVEDHLHNALAGASIGHRTFLLDRPWNSSTVNLSRIERVQTWHGVMQGVVRNAA